MKNSIKILLVATLMVATATSNLVAEENSKKITIEEMEIHLATLGAEIAKEKVKIYEKEALLNEMKLDLIKKKKERNSKK